MFQVNDFLLISLHHQGHSLEESDPRALAALVGISGEFIWSSASVIDRDFKAGLLMKIVIIGVWLHPQRR